MLNDDLTLGSLVSLAVAAYGGLAVFGLFVTFERRGRPELVIAVLLGAVLAQLAVYSVDSRVPQGPFRPGPLRLPELLIIAGVAARLWTRGVGSRVTWTGVAWSVLAVWYLTSFVNGVGAGHSVTTALFHSKFIVYAGGGYVLASGVSATRLVTRGALGAWLIGLGAIATIQLVVTLANLNSLLGPLTPDDIGADAASLYLAIALAVLMVEATRRRGRRWVPLAMFPLLVAPLVVTQRASLVHASSSLVLLVTVSVGLTWRRRVTVRPTQAALGAMTVIVAASVVLLPRLSAGETVPPIVEETIEETFSGVGNVQSAGARVLKWKDAKQRFEEHPLLGAGMGSDFVSFRPGKRGVGAFEQSEVYDSVPMDLLVRSGAVGLLLFIVAVSLSIRDGWRAWRLHPNPLVGGLALGAVLYLVGFVAKGFVESVADKMVLSCAVGIAIGAIASASSDLERAASLDGDPIAATTPELR